MSALLRAEDVTGAADFQVAHGNSEARSHIAELFNRAQSLGGVAGEIFVGIDKQVAVGPMLVPPYPAPQLMQIGKAVLVGLVDEYGIGIRDVQAAFDDGGCQQDVKL